MVTVPFSFCTCGHWLSEQRHLIASPSYHDNWNVRASSPPDSPPRLGMLPAQTLTHTFPMAASTASRIFTPFLHRHQRRTKAVVVAAASPPDAEPTPATADGAGPGKKKTVDTRIHWSNPDEGWVGGKAKKEGDGRGSSKNEPLGGRFADLINNAAESHYQLSSSPIHAHMSFWIAVQLYINL
jgi:hypothetical protein